ncbi:MAG: nucleotide 5'-monophosphate nucleosidase PpnN [Gammaproteobacteria bacterium]|nr:nucleotide 5'-monophosphate nucleosidase PpnN [Gammaproteobacteria bacterium]
MNARITPSAEGSLNILSRHEVAQLLDAGAGGLYDLWRRCSLAVLNAGSEEDDITIIMRRNPDFRIAVVQEEGGIAVDVENAPERAFVDGKMIRGIRDQIFAVLRDLLYTHQTIIENERFDLADSASITDAVFHILRNAHALKPDLEPNLAVCWGGHAISRDEYDYSKRVGYSLGLRGLDVCTGCGQGAMKGPMKGAALGHAKQRLSFGRYVGLTEPTIIAAEAPNPIVNELVILPDMEKRLEAFVRLAHAIVVFPGGVGTAEEILYLLGILLDDDNARVEVPIIMTGPASSAVYFETLRDFIATTLGPQALGRFSIIIDDSDRVAAEASKGVQRVAASRQEAHESFFFNWRLNIGMAFQKPFIATHESMAALNLRANQSPVNLAVNLRRAFSGIVAGNVREEGVKLVAEKGPFELSGDPEIAHALDKLLRGFVAQRRMKLSDPVAYQPCFRVVA